MKKFVNDNFKVLFKVGLFNILLLSYVLLAIMNTNVVSAVSSAWKDEVILNGSVEISTGSQKTIDELLAQGIEVGFSEEELIEVIERIISTNDEELRKHYYAELAKIQGEYDLTELIAQLENIGNNVLIEGIPRGNFNERNISVRWY